MQQKSLIIVAFTFLLCGLTTNIFANEGPVVHRKWSILPQRVVADTVPTNTSTPEQKTNQPAQDLIKEVPKSRKQVKPVNVTVNTVKPIVVKPKIIKPLIKIN